MSHFNISTNVRILFFFDKTNVHVLKINYFQLFKLGQNCDQTAQNTKSFTIFVYGSITCII
jgi:hypothetical protein